ncbi:type II toxin-antitoxin system HicB family antitoxin [Patescibacteria group bacterium]|nr:type II toxin-antitoxin system HicB family antitoxin [Patescibacteria group bacterium]
MIKVPLKIVIWKEGKHYVSWCLNNGVSSFGDTKKGALESLQEALELYFEDVPLENVTKVERPDIIPFIFQYA